MKKIKSTFKIFSVLIFLILNTTILLPDDNTIIKALKDELKRSMEELKVESLNRPYYLEYTLKIKDSYSIKSSLGSIIESNNTKTAQLTVGLRVGDYKFDNTNFFDFGFSFFGSGDEEESFKNRRIPIEMDYKSLRRELWLATDAAYKQVSESFSKKQAVIKNRLRTDTTHDFLQIAPEKYYDTTKIPEFDKGYFELLLKNISLIFGNYPAINNSAALVEYLPETVYYVNSEGREYIKTSFYCGLEIVAVTQADDGMPLLDFFTAYSKQPYELPHRDSLISAAKSIGENLTFLTKSSFMEEPYSGPVLFEGQAAAEIFAQVFAPNLVTQREPLTEAGSQDNDRYTSFQSKIGGRVLPEFLTVKAIPSMNYYGMTPVLGSYKIDDDGVLAEDVLLVKDGYLKNLLSSRVPTRRVRKTNGHQRGGAAMLSVLQLSSDSTHKKSRKELVEKMISLCKDRELPYGIIVRKVTNQNLLLTTVFQLSAGDFPMPQGLSKIPLIQIYKVFPDGREELIRGTEAKGFTVQSFKDLIGVGNKDYCLNFLAPAISSPFITGGSQYLGTTVIVPDLLFEDGEIQSVERDFPKPPIISSPLIKK